MCSGGGEGWRVRVRGKCGEYSRPMSSDIDVGLWVYMVRVVIVGGGSDCSRDESRGVVT